MIKAIYVMESRHGSSKELFDLLKSISDRNSFQLGCISSEVWVNEEASQIMLMESWRSSDDLIHHINSKIFRRVLAAMELGASKPEVKFFECNTIRGMDMIEEVRMSGKAGIGEDTQ